MIMSLLLAAMSGFIGYILGRICHYWLNPLFNNPDWAPHHWIYGLLIVVYGWYATGLYGLLIAAFGIGFFVSDLRDFLNGEIIGPDDDTEPARFWGID